MDVKTAFLYGYLNETIYMAQPEGYIDSRFPNKVCKLIKCIYGLKQASRMWYERFNTYLVKNGFTKGAVDSNIYIKRELVHEKFVILALYVDNSIIISNDLLFLNNTKKLLASGFEMTDEGPIEHGDGCLGMVVERNKANKSISISQTKYITKILNRFNMFDCKPVSTPLETGLKLTNDMSPIEHDDIEKMKEVPYSIAVGCLMHVMTITRPDIAYAVGQVARFMSNPGQAHWSAVKRIMRYLKGTLNFKIIYQPKKDSVQYLHQVQAWSDSDWASDEDSRKSTSGYVFTLAGGAISWQSRRQSTIALSSTEAEYIASASAAKEAMWIRQLMTDIGYHQWKELPLYCDNTSTIALTKNPRNHDRSKHIDIKYHYLEKGWITEISLLYIVQLKIWLRML